jgi:hypothetical protein
VNRGTPDKPDLRVEHVPVTLDEPLVRVILTGRGLQHGTWEDVAGGALEYRVPRA